MVSFISQQPLNNVTGTVANRTVGEFVLKHHLKPFNWVLEQFEEINMRRAELVSFDSY